MIKFRKGMTRVEVVDAMIAVKTKEEAQAFFDAVVEATMEESTVHTRQRALDLTSHKLGYMTGYSMQIDVELWESVGAVQVRYECGVGYASSDFRQRARHNR